MNKLKRFFTLLCAAAMGFTCLLSFAACADQSDKQVLRVYNWEDYIDPDIITAFEEEYDCTVEYSTFGTNENMYNELKINQGGYDLVCPSDYMIMKMIAEDMCEPFSQEFRTNGVYSQYVSPYIRNLFEENGWTDYAVGYMWGTMGFMYNPENVDAEDVKDWKVLENEKYHKKSTLKNSVRDTYFYALACVYQDELQALASQLEDASITKAEYTAELKEIMNRTDQDSVDKAREYLREIKKSVYGFEVDSGKNDMVTGKIDLNFCWSGDAAYGIWEADDENGFTLAYSVPELVSNVWFDGWVIPKGGNRSLAEKFLNFISLPENAMLNMDYIGYTSVIAGEEIYSDYVEGGYAVEEEGEELQALLDAGEAMEYDVSYFFKEEGDSTEYTFYAYTEDMQGMLLAQYPTEEIVQRCVIMQYFDEAGNNRINMMWEDVKGAAVPLGAVIFIGVIVLALLGVFLISNYGYEWFKPRPKKGYYKVEK
ncbi:MAG: ABC transporter substrate-binding protein [Clostridia bacterium]|nr:ABC transporter substrate-binding protein [Clostridia bacterium]